MHFVGKIKLLNKIKLEEKNILHIVYLRALLVN